jgi:site-specific DNA recombinase
MKDERKKAVIYCRVSSDKQVREGHGLEGQERSCRDFAKFHNLDVVDVIYDEGISGGTIDRPGLQKLFGLIEKSKVKITVIVDDINRIARDVVTHFAIRKFIKDAGGEFLSVNMKLEDTPDGEFIETIMAAAAQLERTRNRERVISRMDARIKAGYWSFDSPPGYKYEKVEGHGKLLVLDEPKASIIREAIEGFASGRFFTQSDVKAFLDSKNFHHRRQTGQVHLEQVKRILTRKLYTGKIEYLKWGITERDGHHQAIISYATYLKVQERLNGKIKESANYDLSTDFPLRRFILCSECNQPYTASWSTSRNKKKHPYYRCSTKNCGQKNVRRDLVHDEFHQLLISLKPNENIKIFLKKIVAEQYELRLKNNSSLMKEAYKKNKELDHEMEKLTTTLVKLTNDVAIKRIEQRLEDLEKQKTELELQSNDTTLSLPDFETAFDKVFQFILNIDQAWLKGDLKQQKMVQYLVFPKNLSYTKKEGFGTASKSLLFELSSRLDTKDKGMVEVAGIEPASQRQN